MATKEEIQKQNIAESNDLLSEQIGLVTALSDVMKDVVSSNKQRGELDKASLDLTRQSVRAAQNVSSEYDSVKSVQKDIVKDQQLQQKIQKQVLTLTGQLNKTEKDNLKAFQDQNKVAKDLEAVASKLANDQKRGLDISQDALETAQLEAMYAADAAAISGAKLSNQAEQVAHLEHQQELNAGITGHLNEQLKRQQNIEKAGGRTVKNTAALGKIFDKLGMSGVGKVFTNASEEAKKLAYEQTKGGKTAITMFGKMKVAAKGFGLALKVAMGPLALITMAIGFMKKLAAKGKEGAAHMRAMSHDTMVMGRELGVSGTKAKELAGQATAIGGAMGMTTGAAKQAAGAVYSALDGAEKVSNKTLKTFITLNKYAGMSADSIKDIKSLSKLSGQEVSKVANAMADTAKHSIKTLKLNTSMKTLMTAVGKVSNNVKLAMGGSAAGITKAVAQAKKLGLEMSEVEGIASSLLNFEDSIAAEMEAELLTGKELNLEKARTAALNGDNVGLMAELANQGINASDYSAMNVLQQEALAKALGMNRGQMADMLVTQKENVAENVNMVDLQKQGISAIASMASAQETRAAQDEAQILALDKINNAMSKFENAMIKIQKLMTPMVDLIFAPIFDLVADTAESLAGWLGTTTTINEETGEYIGNVDLIHNVVKGIAIAYVGILATMKLINIAKGISAFFNKEETKDALLTMQYRGLQAQQWVALQGKKAAGWVTEKAHWAAKKASDLAEKTAWVGLQAKKVAGWAAEKAAMISQKALQAAAFVKDVGIAAMRAISSLAAIPVVGIGLGIAAAATVAAMAVKYMNDGTQGPVGGGKPGYSRTMFGPEGAISFNDKDTIVAGTNLKGSGGGGSGGGNTSSPTGGGSSDPKLVFNSEKTNQLLERLIKAVEAGGTVTLDGQKVGNALVAGSYRMQ
jgi:hypothetical protein